MQRAQGYQPESVNGNGHYLHTLPLVRPTDFQEADNDNFNPREILAIARRRGLIIAAVAVSVTIAMGLNSSRQKPVYTSKAEILVEPISGEQNRLSQLTQMFGGALGGGAAGSSSTLDYSTQIQVLRSREIMLPIIEEIQVNYPNLSYDSVVNNLGIRKAGDTKLLQIDYRESDPEQIEFVLNKVIEGFVNYSRNEQKTDARKGLEFVDQQLPKLYQRVDGLQKQLQAFQEQYNFMEPETRAAQLTNRMSAIDQQRVDNLLTLNETRSLYAVVQQQLGFTPSEAMAVTALEQAPRYQALLNQLKEVESQIALESAKFTEDNPTIQTLREQQRNLLPLLAQESAAILGNSQVQANTELSSPNAIRSQLTQQLVDTANQIQVLQVRQAAIAQAQADLQAQIAQMPQIARYYKDLQRQVTVATESLNRFLTSKNELEIQSAQQGFTWKVVLAPERPTQPVSATLERSLILGAVAGLLLGMGIALLVDKLDNVFHSVDELKQKTKLPLLGTIPLSNNTKPAIRGAVVPTARFRDRYSSQFHQIPEDVRSKNSPFLEAFRSLYTNISFMGSDTPIDSLVVSSAVQGEGKSTVAINLAQAAAVMGQRVLIVDVDMRCPQVHELLELDNELGLSNILINNIKPSKVIQSLPSIEDVYVLTAGNPLPPDPLRLLKSTKMQDLIAYLKSEFDFIIYDTPPVLGLSDARVLLPHTASSILVVKLNKTSQDAVVEALDLLKTSSTSVLGTVANAVPSRAIYSRYSYKNSKSAGSELQRAKNILNKGLRKGF